MNEEILFFPFLLNGNVSIHNVINNNLRLIKIYTYIMNGICRMHAYCYCTSMHQQQHVQEGRPLVRPQENLTWPGERR